MMLPTQDIFWCCIQSDRLGFGAGWWISAIRKSDGNLHWNHVLYCGYYSTIAVARHKRSRFRTVNTYCPVLQI